MKLNPRVSQLALYDIRGGPGEFCFMLRRRIFISSQLTNIFL
jgi:hypothetical protein